MNKISFEIGAWTLAFSTIEMLFHTLETGLFMFVVFVEEAVLSLRIVFNRLVGDRVDIMTFVLGPRNLLQLFLISKVGFISVSHRHTIEFVTCNISGD